MRTVDLCPDKQSPELSVPCSTVPLPPSPDMGQTLPFTGTAWFYLLLGIAIGAIIMGAVIVYYNRGPYRNRTDDE